MIDIDDINYDEVLNGIDISFNEVLEMKLNFKIIILFHLKGYIFG
jgi:hypothetical protein